MKHHAQLISSVHAFKVWLGTLSKEESAIALGTDKQRIQTLLIEKPIGFRAVVQDGTAFEEDPHSLWHKLMRTGHPKYTLGVRTGERFGQLVSGLCQESARYGIDPRTFTEEQLKLLLTNRLDRLEAELRRHWPRFVHDTICTGLSSLRGEELHLRLCDNLRDSQELPGMPIFLAAKIAAVLVERSKHRS